MIFTKVCFFSSGASPSNTKIGRIRKNNSLQSRWNNVRRWAFSIAFPWRSRAPLSAWFSQMLISRRTSKGKQYGISRFILKLSVSKTWYQQTENVKHISPFMEAGCYLAMTESTQSQLAFLWFLITFHTLNLKVIGRSTPLLLKQ